MSYVQISTNATALAHVLGDVHGKQIPFATALALTEVAFKVQREEKSEMARTLKLRNKFSQSGVQVNPAERSDWPTIYSEVGIEQRRSYLIDHVTGGNRQGGTHGRAILEQEGLRSGSGRVPAAKRPGAMIARAMRAKRQAELAKTFGGKQGRDKRLPFLIHSDRWGGEVLVQRTGNTPTPLRTVYAFKRGVTIKREFEMDTIGRQEVARAYYPAFRKALDRAIKTSK